MAKNTQPGTDINITEVPLMKTIISDFIELIQAVFKSEIDESDWDDVCILAHKLEEKYKD